MFNHKKLQPGRKIRSAKAMMVIAASAPIVTGINNSTASGVWWFSNQSVLSIFGSLSSFLYNAYISLVGSGNDEKEVITGEGEVNEEAKEVVEEQRQKSNSGEDYNSVNEVNSGGLVAIEDVNDEGNMGESKQRIEEVKKVIEIEKGQVIASEGAEVKEYAQEQGVGEARVEASVNRMGKKNRDQVDVENLKSKDDVEKSEKKDENRINNEPLLEIKENQVSRKQTGSVSFPFADRIPVAFWTANNCGINAAAYTLMAPENVEMFERILHISAEGLVNEINKKLNGGQDEKYEDYLKTWNAMSPEQKLNEMERFKRSTDTLLKLTRNDLSKNSVDGKFSIAGKIELKIDGSPELTDKLNNMETNLLGKATGKSGEHEQFREKGTMIEPSEAIAAFGAEDALSWGGNATRLPYFSLLGDKSRYKILGFNTKLKELELNVIDKDQCTDNMEKRISAGVDDEGNVELMADWGHKLVTLEGGSSAEANMYLAAINYQKADVRKDGTCYCIQPKYKLRYDETTQKSEFEVVAWLKLSCHGKNHELLSKEEFLKEMSSLGENARAQISARYVSQDDLAKNSDFYCITDKDMIFSENSQGGRSNDVGLDEKVSKLKDFSEVEEDDDYSLFNDEKNKSNNFDVALSEKNKA